VGVVSVRQRRILNDTALGVLLVLLGGVIAHISLNGDYLNYVKPSMRWMLLIAAPVLLVIGGATLWRELTYPAQPRHAGTPAPSEDADGHEGHDHGHAPGVGWLLFLPALVLALAAPPALGADAASRVGNTLTKPSGDFPPLPDGDPVQLTMPDYAARAVFDQGRSLGDRNIQLTGFVTLGTAGQVYLTRMVITCCAADARPVKVALTGQVPTALSDNTWLQVVGRYTSRQATDTINAATIPFLDVSTAAQIAVPADQYTS
jgi:uncharacterized repeat protein (TIGR03943 family)